jgi:hypothetical protein
LQLRPHVQFVDPRPCPEEAPAIGVSHQAAGKIFFPVTLWIWTINGRQQKLQMTIIAICKTWGNRGAISQAIF